MSHLYILLDEFITYKRQAIANQAFQQIISGDIQARVNNGEWAVVNQEIDIEPERSAGEDAVVIGRNKGVSPREGRGCWR